MNSTKVSSADNRYSVKPFFGFTLKNNWQHFALYLIIMLLVIVLPCVMMLNEYDYTGNYSRYYDWNSVCENMIVTCGLTGILASLGVALFSGMSAASYVNSKQQIGCYHSFPIRREGLFLVETSVRAIYYIAAYLPCALIAWVLININLPVTALQNTVYLKHIFAAILCYLLLYSIILFAGGLTGTAPVRLIMTLLILALPIALYALIVACAGIGIPYLSSEYYLSESVLRVICSPYRTAEAIYKIDSSVNPELAANLFWCIPESIIYYTGALFLHKYRKSESSGTTIIWKPVFIFTKYITIFTAALLGIVVFGSGIFFGNQNAAWLIFGLVFGLVISSMLVNAILYRSSKAIFKGLRGLASVTVLAIVVMLILPMDILGLNNKIYSAHNTKSLEIDGVVFDDPEKIDTLISLMHSEEIPIAETLRTDFVPVSEREDRNISLWNTEYAEKLHKEFHYTVFNSEAEAAAAKDDYTKDRYNFDHSNNTSLYLVDIVQKPKFGIPLAKRLAFSRTGETWGTYVRSAEFDEYVERISKVDPQDLWGIEITLGNYSEYVDFSFVTDEITYEAAAADAIRPTVEYNGMERSVKADYRRIHEITAEILPYCLYDASSRDNGVIVGTISINVVGNSASAELLGDSYVTFPVYADNLEVLNGLCRIINELYSNSPVYAPYPEEFTSADEYIQNFIDIYMAAVAIIDRESGEVRSMSVDQFREIADRTIALRNRSYYNSSEFIDILDSRYWVVAAFNTIDNPEYNDTRTVYFRKAAITDVELAELFERCK